MNQSSLTRGRRGVLLLCLLVVSLPELTARGLQPQWANRRQRQAWLKSEYGKVKKDSERLVTLTRDLRQEALKRKPNPLPPALLDRIEALETRARKLQEAVAALNENILSVPMVASAEEIKNEAKSLRESFPSRSSDTWWKKLRNLAHEIEKRADSVHDRLRYP